MVVDPLGGICDLGWWGWVGIEFLDCTAFWSCSHLCGRGAELGCSPGWRTPSSTSSSRRVFSWCPLLNPSGLASVIMLGFPVNLALPWFLLCCGYPWSMVGTPCCDCFCETPQAAFQGLWGVLGTNYETRRQLWRVNWDLSSGMLTPVYFHSSAGNHRLDRSLFLFANSLNPFLICFCSLRLQCK